MQRTRILSISSKENKQKKKRYPAGFFFFVLEMDYRDSIFF